MNLQNRDFEENVILKVWVTTIGKSESTKKNLHYALYDMLLTDLQVYISIPLMMNDIVQVAEFPLLSTAV